MSCSCGISVRAGRTAFNLSVNSCFLHFESHNRSQMQAASPPFLTNHPFENKNLPCWISVVLQLFNWLLRVCYLCGAFCLFPVSLPMLPGAMRNLQSLPISKFAPKIYASKKQQNKIQNLNGCRGWKNTKDLFKNLFKGISVKLGAYFLINHLELKFFVVTTD